MTSLRVFARPRGTRAFFTSTAPPEDHEHSKMFLQRTDKKTGQIYYVLNSKPFSPKQPSNTEFFAISDLLLDLDAENCKTVREMTEDDEAKLTSRWKTTPTRRRIQDWSSELETHLYKTRRTAFEASVRPLSHWVPTSHDILSAAFRDSITSAAPSAKATRIRDGASKMVPPPPSRTNHEAGLMNTVCVGNDVSSTTSSNPHFLLDMMKERRAISSLVTSNSKRPALLDFQDLLNKQISIAGVRQVATQALELGLEANSRFPTTLQQVCQKLLNETPQDHESRFQVLAFIANLEHRLSLVGARIGPLLTTRAEKLSAEVARPAATFKYFRAGFRDGNLDTKIEATISVLEIYEGHLASPADDILLDALDRQHLLQILTGVDHQGKVVSESVRSLLAQASSEHPQQALALYKSCILLLGRLGAVATLWTEWRSPLSGTKNQTGKGTAERYSNQGNSNIFISAVKTALAVAPRFEELRIRGVNDMGLVGNASFDSQTIEMQDPDCWLWQHPEVTCRLNEVEDGDIREALELPMDKWMEAVGAFQLLNV